MATAPAPEAPENGSEDKRPKWEEPFPVAQPGHLPRGRGKTWEPTARQRLEAAIGFASGCSHQTMALYFGVAKITVQKRFAEEFRMATEMSQLALRQRLWFKAMVEGDTACLIFLAKNMLGMRDRHDLTSDNLPLPPGREELCVRVVYVNPSDPRANAGAPPHLLESPTIDAKAE